MSKYLKSLITICLVVCMTVCVGIFATACINPDDGGDDGAFPSSVSITVLLDDDSPAEGVFVGICAVKADGTLDACLRPVETNAQGVATISLDKENGKNYEIHLSTLPTGYAYVDEHNTPFVGDTGFRFDVTKDAPYTIKLAKVA